MSNHSWPFWETPVLQMMVILRQREYSWPILSLSFLSRKSRKCTMCRVVKLKQPTALQSMTNAEFRLQRFLALQGEERVHRDDSNFSMRLSWSNETLTVKAKLDRKLIPALPTYPTETDSRNCNDTFLCKRTTKLQAAIWAEVSISCVSPGIIAAVAAVGRCPTPNCRLLAWWRALLTFLPAKNKNSDRAHLKSKVGELFLGNEISRPSIMLS